MRPPVLIWLALTLIAVAFGSVSPAAAQPHPCRALTPCTPVKGPWVTTPAEGENTYTLSCPQGMRAVNGDAAFPSAVYPVSVAVSGGHRPGVVSAFYFGVIALPVSVTYQPWLACSPPGAITLQFRAQTTGTAAPLRTHMRTTRIRPGRHVRLRLGCARGERLVNSGSAVAFFTRRPPSPRIVKALEHRHRRTGSTTRTDVTAPAGVGDHERVELQVSTFCSR